MEKRLNLNKDLSSSGDTRTNNNNSFFGREMVKKKRKEILRIFNDANDKSVSYTSIAETTSKNLGVNCNRKFVRKVLKNISESKLRKKLIKLG